MNNNNFIYILLFIFPFFLKGQNLELNSVKGRILVGTNYMDGVNVKNETTRQSSVSVIEGYFRISAKVGDIIVFSAVNLESRTKIVTKADLSAENLIITMQVKSVILKEVNIGDYQKITPQSVGIPGATRFYTPAERKLFTATSGFGIDGLLNTISGRKQMLKKEVEIEKKEENLSKLEYLFKDEFYTEKLLIPKDYIKGFQYYCIEDTPFINALKAKNKTLVEFLIVKLAENYNQIISNENK